MWGRTGTLSVSLIRWRGRRRKYPVSSPIANAIRTIGQYALHTSAIGIGSASQVQVEKISEEHSHGKACKGKHCGLDK
jgi:hypothetical protein